MQEKIQHLSKNINILLLTLKNENYSKSSQKSLGNTVSE